MTEDATVAEVMIMTLAVVATTSYVMVWIDNMTPIAGTVLEMHEILIETLMIGLILIVSNCIMVTNSSRFLLPRHLVLHMASSSNYHHLITTLSQTMDTSNLQGRHLFRITCRHKRTSINTINLQSSVINPMRSKAIHKCLG
jgi:hypothetical protein